MKAAATRSPDDLMSQLQSLFSSQWWLGYLVRALHGLLLAIPIAALFELSGWLLRRWVLQRMAAPLAKDAGREPVARARRRRVVRDVTLLALRWGWNLIAIVVILMLWGVDPLASVLLILALLLVGWPLVRDTLAGYGLLLDDCLGPGDRVVINGTVEGTVIESGLRRVRVQHPDGRTIWLPSSEVREVANYSQAGSPAEENQ